MTTTTPFEWTLRQPWRRQPPARRGGAPRGGDERSLGAGWTHFGAGGASCDGGARCDGGDGGQSTACGGKNISGGADRRTTGGGACGGACGGATSDGGGGCTKQAGDPPRWGRSRWRRGIRQCRRCSARLAWLSAPRLPCRCWCLRPNRARCPRSPTREAPRQAQRPMLEQASSERNGAGWWCRLVSRSAWFRTDEKYSCGSTAKITQS